MISICALPGRDVKLRNSLSARILRIAEILGIPELVAVNILSAVKHNIQQKSNYSMLCNSILLQLSADDYPIMTTQKSSTFHLSDR